jgi:hypothetical protein
MEALQVTAGGIPAFTIGVLFAAAVWDALTCGAPVWVLTEPLGVLVVGTGVIWFPGLLPLFLGTGIPLFAVGGWLSKGYSTGYLPRQPRRLYKARRREKLPPI